MAEGDLDELWRRVVASWDDAAAHEAFVERSRAEGSSASRRRATAR